MNQATDSPRAPSLSHHISSLGRGVWLRRRADVPDGGRLSLTARRKIAGLRIADLGVPSGKASCCRQACQTMNTSSNAGNGTILTGDWTGLDPLL